MNQWEIAITLGIGYALVILTCKNGEKAYKQSREENTKMVEKSTLHLFNVGCSSCSSSLLFSVVDASICWSVEPRLWFILKPICERGRRVYYLERIIDLVYNVLMFNLNSDQLYKPTNVWSNVKRSTFQYDRCSNVGGSNPMRSNVSITNVSFQWKVPMQWTNECPANGWSV